MSREPAALIVLAGGDGKRMGFPKHRLAVDGERILHRLCRRLGLLFTETIVVGRGIQDLPSGARLVEDLYDIRAALVGIHAGLSASTKDLTFVAACDMPYVEPALVEYLLVQAEGADVVVPVVRGYYEPLCAVYRKTCLESIERLIEEGSLKVSNLFELIRLGEVSEEQILQHDPELQSFVNVNAPTEIGTATRPDRVGPL